MHIDKQKEIIKPLFFFKTVVDTGSFTRATKILGIEEPNICKAVHSLEKSLGAKLLSKTQNGMQPTHKGLMLYDNALKINTSFSEIEKSLIENDNVSGNITISLTDGIGIYLIPKLMDFCKIYPNVSLRFVSSNNEPDIKNKEVDIAIVYQYPRIDKSMVVKEYSREFGLFASTSFINQFGMPEDETDMLENYNFCNHCEYYENWGHWRDFMTKAKHKIIEFDASNMLIQATDSGLGLALHPLKYGLERTNWVLVNTPMAFHSPYWVLSHCDEQDTDKIKTMLLFIEQLTPHI